MKKIVLGCAAVLLSLGLLAGCNNDTDSAVTISVDNTATVVVGDTLELPYTVEPEKAKVEVLNDHEEYVTASAKDGVLTLEGVAAGSATITLVGTYKKYTEANVDIKVSVVTEGEVDQGPGVPDTGGSEEVLLGSFDFSTNEKDGAAISSASDLDEFWSGEDIYKGVSEYDTVYLGNGTGGAFENETKLIKFGTTSLNGTLQLKFAVGTCIDKVVLTAHSWYKVSEEYPDQEPNQLVVNGESQDCSVSGTATELTYTITDDWTYLLTFESVGRVTIHSIDIYGTYDPENAPLAESITIGSEDIQNPLNIADIAEITVSWSPEGSILDFDELEWSAGSEGVVEINATQTGATVHAVGEGTAYITASAYGVTSNALEIVVENVLVDTETIDPHSFGLTRAESLLNTTLKGHQVELTFAQNNGNNNPVYYTDDGFRLYANNSITITPTYEEKGVTITSISFATTYNGSTAYYGNDAAEITDANGDSAGTITNPKTNGCTISIEVSATGALTYTNWKSEDDKTGSKVSGGTQLRIESIVINYTIAQ